MSPFDEVGDRVFRRRYPSLDLNVGVVMGEAGLVVIDTRANHRQADELREELKMLTGDPVVAVINTHFHWDHVWGNARFHGVPISGHIRCRESLLQHGEDMRTEVLESLAEDDRAAVQAVVTVPPSETFHARATVDIGDRRVRMSHHGRGHTDGDIVVWVDGADVIFVGDLVEEGAPPSYGSAFPQDWAPTLVAIERELPSVVVPGHGDVVGRSYVADQRRDIAAVAEAVAAHPRDAAAPPSGPYPTDVMATALRRYRETSRSESRPADGTNQAVAT